MNISRIKMAASWREEQVLFLHIIDNLAKNNFSSQSQRHELLPFLLLNICTNKVIPTEMLAENFQQAVEEEENHTFVDHHKKKISYFAKVNWLSFDHLLLVVVLKLRIKGMDGEVGVENWEVYLLCFPTFNMILTWFSTIISLHDNLNILKKYTQGKLTLAPPFFTTNRHFWVGTKP